MSGEWVRRLSWWSEELDTGDERSCSPAARFYGLAGRGAIAMGLTAYLMGLVTMLQSMEDPAAIGPGIARAMLPLLYGVVLSELVFVPLRTWATKKRPTDDSTGRSSSTLLLSLHIVTFALTSAFALMLARAHVPPAIYQVW